MSIVLAVLAAVANATASVLQRKATRREPERRAFSVRMVWDLLHRPVWFGGIAAILGGFLLQAGALGTGSIAVVQPILVFELPATLVLASMVFHSRLHAREWLAIAGMTGGLVLFLYALSPTAGSPQAASDVQWGVGIAVILALIGVAVWLGWRNRDARRAAYLGVATGMTFALIAALITGMTAAFAHGIVGVFTAWQTYLIIVFGPASFFLLQNALQAGRLAASQPALTLSDPVVAIVWGIVVFSAQVRTGWWLVGALVGAGLVAACTVLLSRSPMLQGEAGQMEGEEGSEEPREPEARRPT